jgi:hypothetical protein
MEQVEEQVTQITDILTSKDGVWKMDIDAFVPKPEGFIKLGRVEYPIYNFLDVPIEDSIKVASLGDDIHSADKDYASQMERSIEQIMLLNAPGLPRLTREHFKRVSPKQIIQLTTLASSIAKIPLKPGVSSPSSSATPSPASGVSTAGSERDSSGSPSAS